MREKLGIFSQVADKSMKGKPLLPSLRQKKRYVAYEYMSEKELSDEEVFRAIILSFKELFGKITLARANIKNLNLYKKKGNEKIYIEKKKNKSILRINHKYIDELRVAMSQISEIKNIKINIFIIGISGIIKKTKVKYMQ